MEGTMSSYVFVIITFLFYPIQSLSNLDTLFQGLKADYEGYTSIHCISPDKEPRLEPMHLQCSFDIKGKPHVQHLRKINPRRYNIPVYFSQNNRLTPYEENIHEDSYYQNDDNTMTVVASNIDGQFHFKGTYVEGKTVYIIHPDDKKGYSNENVHRIFTVKSTHRKIGKVLHATDKYEPVNKRLTEDAEDVSSLSYTVEVLVWIDYRLYQYITTNITKVTKTSVVDFVKQYMGILFDSVNIPYRRLTQAGLHINIKPVSIIISTVASGSPWTEKNKIPSRSHAEAINITKALHDFEKNVDNDKHLPPHDHAMLFTYYSVEDNDTLTDNETEVKGIATLGAMCGNKSSSVISDQMEFETAFTVAHELGHGLGAEHDGTKNSCQEEEGYVMTPVIKRNTTHEWVFSSCTINYFKKLISNLNSRRSNCLLKQNNHQNNQISVYSKEWYGHIYTADQQCELQYGPSSFFDRSDFNFTGSYQTQFCLRMDCYDESIDKYHKTLPGDGTPCGTSKWCMAGECVQSSSHPDTVLDFCPNGNGPDFLVHKIWVDDPAIAKLAWTHSCKAYIAARREHCYDIYVRAICCMECSKVVSSYPHGLPSSVYNHVPNVYDQCSSLFGSQASFCPHSSTYNVSYEPVCSELRCKVLDDSCHETYASDGTPCGKKKWCVLGKCVSDANAPDLPGNCMFGDDVTYTKYNMNCSELIKARPQDCYNSYVKEKCCRSCQTAGNQPIDYRKVPSPDNQCKGIYGQDSYFCQRISDYDTNFHSMCADMYCKKSGSELCYSTQAADGTPCGHKMVCIRGNCTYSVNGPNYRDDCIFPNENSWCDQNIVSKETAYKCTFGQNADVCCFNCQKYVNTSMPSNCQYGDIGNYKSHKMNCKQLITLSPAECYDARTRNQCCESCHNIPKFNPANPGTIPTKNQQCQKFYGSTARFCDGVDTYKTNPGAVCQTLYCSTPNDNLCHGIVAADGTNCGVNKWCVEGRCVAKHRR